MPSNNDYQRRRLRDVYDRNKRNVDKLANARNRRGNNASNSRRNDRGNNRRGDDMAPRRYVVTERRTRREGFGKGGMQVRAARDTRRGGFQSRFADRGIARRGNRDRFERPEDRNRDNRRQRREVTRGEGRNRAGRRGDRNDNRDNNRNNNVQRGGRFGNRGNKNDKPRGSRRGDNNRDNKKNNNNARNGDRNNNKKDNKKNNNSTRGKKNDKKKNDKKPTLSNDDLDAQLDKYKSAGDNNAAPANNGDAPAVAF